MNCGAYVCTCCVQRTKHGILMRYNMGKTGNKNMTDKKRSDIKGILLCHG